MPRVLREYHLNGFAGLILERTSRATGTLFAVYQALPAGIECDPETPYATICCEHSTLICSATRRQAERAIVYPDWCSDCQAKLDQKD